MKLQLIIDSAICMLIGLLCLCKINSGAPVSDLEEAPQIIQNYFKGRSDFDSESVDNNSTSYAGPTATLNFLRQFGYLEPLDSNSSETLYSEERIAHAIREMQKFGALPETGQLDNATLSLLKKPRCGVPDVMHSRPKRYAFGSKGWNKRLLTYRIENLSSKLNEAEVSEDLEKAFKVWADYSHLRFVKKSHDADKVDIAISFGRGYHGDRYPFDGPGGTLGHAFFPQNYDDLGGDAHFDEDEPWYSPSSTSAFDGTSNSEGGTERRSRGISFLDVAVHELGHSLGLAHSSVPTSVMFPYYQSPKSNQVPTLDYDDIMALYQLYVVRNIDDGGNGFRPDAEPTPSTPSGTFPTSSAAIPESTSTIYVTTEDTVPATSENPPFLPPKGDKEPETGLPDLCKGGFDTISYLRGEIFVFKNEYMWRFKNQGQPAPGGYPAKISRLFSILKGVNRVDAAFEREDDGAIIFISGKFYWIFNGEVDGNSGPHTLSQLGLPQSLDQLDAGFVWGKNRMTYFFRDNQYWKYNDTIKGIEGGYPKDIGSWRGVPESLTSAIRYKDDKTYFFKNDEFWRFDDTVVHTEDGFPMKTSKIWFNC